MALTIGDNFSYQGAKPLDGRIKYDTLAAMVAMPDSTLYDGCIAYCVGEDKNYQWKSTNTVDATTGKWREFEAGGGSSEATVLTGTLTTSGWSNKSQTVTITGMTASTNGVIGLLNTATDAQIAAAATAKIKPTAQGTNSVTFTCEAVPAVDIPFGVVIGGGSSALVIDSVIDSLSENAVQNKVIAEALDGKVDKVDGKGLSTNDYDNTEKTKVTRAFKNNDTTFTDIVDADYIPVYDASASANKRSLWSNIKSLLKTYFDNVYSTVTTSKSASDSGTDLSLVTTGEKYTWNNKASKVNYSTNEQDTGALYNNKTVYRKTITTTLPDASTGGTEVSKAVDIGTTVGFVLNIYAVSYSSKGIYYPIPYIKVVSPVSGVRVLVTDNDSTADNGKNKLIVVNSDINRNGYTILVTIEYTKT